MGKLFEEVKKNPSILQGWLEFYPEQLQEGLLNAAEDAGLSYSQFEVLFGDGENSIPQLIKNIEARRSVHILDILGEFIKSEREIKPSIQYDEAIELCAIVFNSPMDPKQENSKSKLESLLNTDKPAIISMAMILMNIYIRYSYVWLYSVYREKILIVLKGSAPLPPLLLLRIIDRHLTNYSETAYETDTRFKNVRLYDNPIPDNPFTDPQQVEEILKRHGITRKELLEDSKVKEYLGKLEGPHRGVLTALLTREIPAANASHPATGKLFAEVKRNSEIFKDWLNLYIEEELENLLNAAEIAGVSYSEFKDLFGNGEKSIPKLIQKLSERKPPTLVATILLELLTPDDSAGSSSQNARNYIFYFSAQELHAIISNNPMDPKLKNSKSKLEFILNGKNLGKAELVWLHLHRHLFSLAIDDFEVAIVILKQNFFLKPIMLINLIDAHKDYRSNNPFTDPQKLEVLLKPYGFTRKKLLEDPDVKEHLEQLEGPHRTALTVLLTKPVTHAPSADTSHPVKNRKTTTHVSSSLKDEISDNDDLVVKPQSLQQQSICDDPQGALKQIPSEEDKEQQNKIKKMKELLDRLTRLINKSDINPFSRSYRDKRRALQELKDLLLLNLSKTQSKNFFPENKLLKLQEDNQLNDRYKLIFDSLQTKHIKFTISAFINEWLSIEVSERDVHNDKKKKRDPNEHHKTNKENEHQKTNKKILYSNRCSFFLIKKSKTEIEIDSLKHGSSFGDISMQRG